MTVSLREVKAAPLIIVVMLITAMAPHLWQNLHQFLIGLFSKFELIHQLNPDELLVPSLLPLARPPTWSDKPLVDAKVLPLLHEVLLCFYGCCNLSGLVIPPPRSL
jgi:hypothetical protein